jgi:hypothetical protein
MVQAYPQIGTRPRHLAGCATRNESRLFYVLLGIVRPPARRLGRNAEPKRKLVNASDKRKVVNAPDT